MPVALLEEVSCQEAAKSSEPETTIDQKAE
jgi:hypothetical protein